MMFNTWVTENYKDLRESGQTACARGVIRPFPGFGDHLKRGLTLSFPFGSATARAQAVFKTLSSDTPLSLMGAVTDFPLHGVLLEAKASVDMDSRMAHEGKLRDLRAAVRLLLMGTAVTFDQLILQADGTIILAARMIPEVIKGTRVAVEASCRQLSLAPSPLNHILHSVQARITRLPEDEGARIETLKRFHTTVEALNRELMRDPIAVTVMSVDLEQTYRFLTGHD